MLLLLTLSLMVSTGQVCFSQTTGKAKGPARTGSCDGINLEQKGYTITSTRVDNPFDFLPWVKIKVRRAADQIAKLLDNKPFLYSAVQGEAIKIIEKENFLPPTSDTRLELRAEFITADCKDKNVDLVYRIYSTQIMPVLSSAPEARVTEKEAPQTAAGQTTVQDPASSPFHFIPTGGYDSTNKLFGGGRLEITRKNPWKFPFDKAIVEGQASSTMKTISASLSGSSDPEASWLAHAEWLLNFSNFSLPTGAGQLKGGHLSAQFSAMSKPLIGGNYTIRFGGLLEGGNRQSSVRDVPLSPNTVANAGYGALKLYVGLDSRLRHNVFSISYGLELGSVGPAARVDWRKHIADVRHEFWYPVGDHKILDLESRFTIGRIQVPGKIPLSERFFGGNNEELFIPDDSWQIRESPVIRAIPASRFYRTADAIGGDRFVSYNLTAAYSVWEKPLVPTELMTDTDLPDLLEGQLNSATNFLKSSYGPEDKNLPQIVAQLPAVQSQLEILRNAVAKAQGEHPGQFEAEFEACLKMTDGAIESAKSIQQDSDKYGGLLSLLSTDTEDPDEVQLIKVSQACKDKLSPVLGDAAVTQAASNFDILQVRATKDFADLQTRITRLADNDMKFTRRTLNTLFNEVNIYSVSPIFVFDVAKIGREKNGFGGVRYGPGAGIRLELATIAHFTVGYAWNVNRGPGEGHGTMFFKIGIRDLFH